MFTHFKFTIVSLISLTSLIFSADVTLSIDGTELNYVSTSEIAGWQFNHDGCALNASGGDTEANGLMISCSAGVCLAFSMTGGDIPAGAGLLVDLGDECSTLTNLVFSGSAGNSLDVELSDGGGGSNADHTVEVGPGMSFSPADLNVAVGETVEWVWVGGEHNVNGSTDTFPNNPDSFYSGEPQEGGTYQFSFTVAGDYYYQCDPHGLVIMMLMLIIMMIAVNMLVMNVIVMVTVLC